MDKSVVPRKDLQFWLVFIFFSVTNGYYNKHRCFATGDCILTIGYTNGGLNDEYHKWNIECNDGEAMVGIFDGFKQFMGIEQIWCTFTFVKKHSARGVFPYYPFCNVRNISMEEYYCYDKHWPTDTIDTFMTGIYSPGSYNPVVPQLMKCCKTPFPYKLDYTRCQWKYTHDKAGEHYDGFWLVKCDTHHVMTGMGQALNPWDNIKHVVWIQCCPVVDTELTGKTVSFDLGQLTVNHLNTRSSVKKDLEYSFKNAVTDDDILFRGSKYVM